MKILNPKSLFYLLVLCIPVLLTSCKDDEPKNDPTISITPVTAEAIPGGTVDFTINVTADRLVSVSLNGTEIKTYSNNENTDSFTYTYTFPANETTDQDLTFTVTDGRNNVFTANALVTYVQPPLSLANFSSLRSSTAKWGDWWEGDGSALALNDYNGATYGGGDASNTMYVTSRGGFANPAVWNFSATAPGDTETSLMMSRSVLENADGSTAWGGYMIPVLGYYDADAGQSVLPENEMIAVKNNARVIAVDVYYEANGGPVSFSDISSFRAGTAGDAGAVKDKEGYKIQLRLGNLLKFQTRPDGSDNGFYVIREAYLTAPGEWQTLKFTVEDPGEANVALDATANEIDFAWLIPAYAYESFDYGKLYIKNVRIVNPE